MNRIIVTGGAGFIGSAAANFIRTVETRQGLQIACLQEIAYENGWMTKGDIRDSVQDMLKIEYGQYLLKLVEE